MTAASGPLRNPWAWGVAAATAAVFSRSLGADFISLDDLEAVVRNPHIRSFTASNIRWMLGLNWVHWYPLTWISFALDYAVWGGRPFGFHLTNVLLHALNAAQVFVLFDLLLKKRARAAAAFGALLFSLHPLRVESVAWVTERSDLLSAAFILATALAWLRRRDGSALIFHALGLLTKGVGMTVPLVLLALDRLGLSGRPWPGNRIALARMAPFLALSVADGLVNKIAQDRAGATWSIEKLGFFGRLMVGAWNYAHNLGKTLWPSDLMGLYPMPKPFDPFEPRFALAAALFVLIGILAWRLRRRAPALAGAWMSYVLIMFPMAGFIKTGPQLMADRYGYVAALGFAGLAAEGLRRGLSGPRRAGASAAAAAVLILLSGLTWRLQGDWLDTERFWGAMVALDPRHAIARHLLGLENLRLGRIGEAERLLRESVALDPTLGPAQNSLANFLAKSGRAEESLAHYRASIAASPRQDEPRRNLAVALIGLGRREEAARTLREELAIHPEVEGARRLLESLSPR